ncbi:FliM/FliN family flagellar motor switch protein [uncultured Cellulomonas sp.]|uniref:FliM/FliN family flagellar motor switch protein n=1 Tax=uncultured Cellulomonas sp. TaxID=189682 RepID=UPI002610242F|nr:FliM/FliN family flagellar motor switch protein [uncultured Cellulomonas sp.]
MTVQDMQRDTPRRSKKSGQPELYDFRRPMTLAREHGRVLERAFETYARQWGNQLSARLRAVSTVTLESVAMHSYDEYVRALPKTTVMVLCTVDPGRTTSVVQVPGSMVMGWIDLLLGGPGRPSGDVDRELTDIEYQLVRNLVQHSLADIGYAFASVLPMEATVRGVQYAPQFLQAVPASVPVIVATFVVRVGEAEESATMMIPAEVLLAGLRAGESADSRTPEEVAAHELSLASLARGVQDVPVPVAVRFSPVTVRPTDVVGLTVGAVLHLNHPTARPLDVVVDDVVLARAAAGTQGTRLACRIVTSEENA